MSTTLLESEVSTRAKPACRHCGAALIDDRMRASGFCCAGCSYVHRLVHEHGLAGYYQIKDEVTAPADAGVFQPRDYVWLEEAQREADAADGVPTLTVDVQGGVRGIVAVRFQWRHGLLDVIRMGER